jgi:hypothetical protein
MRAYPKGTRIGSSNLDPSLFWRQGVQIGMLIFVLEQRSMLNLTKLRLIGKDGMQE